MAGGEMTAETDRVESARSFPCTDRIHILDDDPAREDQFGAHEALACTIERLIENESGGKAMALEGAWGSGKSTVIEMLKEKLERAGTGKVFVFDGWAHEGDSLRRALIEEFETWLEKQGLASPSKKRWEGLKGRVEELARRQVTQTIRANVKLTFWGRVMVFLLALVPVGLVLEKHFGDWGYWLGLGAVSLPALLLLIFAGVSIVTALSRRVEASGEGAREGLGSAWITFDSVLGIFLRQVEKETQTKGWSTLNPTSIEFARLFRDLLEDVMRGPNAVRTLVCILDNLDRLPGDEAMRAFATLRALFEQGVDATEWMSRFWLLVPYDFSLHIAPDDINADLAGAHASLESEEAFRYKFFQARFSLAQPVLLKWQSYLKECLKEAFPGHAVDDGVLDDICALYALVHDRDFGNRHQDAALSPPYTFPTPREIKIFVNRLSAIHMQWPCEKAHMQASGSNVGTSEWGKIEAVPFIVQAGFAMCEGRVRKASNARPGEDRGQADLSRYVPGNAMNNAQFFRDPELRLIERLGTKSRWERHVAAMWYGVPQGLALHMMLRPGFWEAFSNGTVPYTESIVKMPYEHLLGSRGIGGFWDVGRMVAEEFIGKPDAGAFERCAKTLAVIAKWGDRNSGWDGLWASAEGDAIKVLGSPNAALEGATFPWLCGRNFAVAVGIGDSRKDLARVGLRALAGVPDGQPPDYYKAWAKELLIVIHATVARGWKEEILPVVGQISESPRSGADKLAALADALQKHGGDVATLEPHRAWIEEAAEKARVLQYGPKPDEANQATSIFNSILAKLTA